MKQNLRPGFFNLAVKLWWHSAAFIGLLVLIYLLVTEPEFFWASIFAFLLSLVLGLPLMIIAAFAMRWIETFNLEAGKKINRLAAGCYLAALIAGALATIIDMETAIALASALLLSFTFAFIINRKELNTYFTNTQLNKMDTSTAPEPSSNRIMIKGLITAGLILLMMIPTVFIVNLVRERESRQKQVASEVSDKWAAAQTLSGPYFYIPYKELTKDTNGKPVETINHFWVLPDQLNVSGHVDNQVRERSIYKVLLYRANVQSTGNFILQTPTNVDSASIIWQDARICFGVSDFKGIEERVLIKLNQSEIELSPGLPAKDLDEIGLSAPLKLTTADISTRLPFSMNIKIKGSESLHFVPLGGNSSFALRSPWPSPSFDGNNLPSERNVSDKGFNAIWTFNKANLPFGTLLQDTEFNAKTLAFGVTMVQPADQYAKTERAVKYALLIIGLTFSLFFIVEISQKKPVHPVQYVLIGLALVIFYTLLLSISEFFFFDAAYLIAALATIILITLYAKAHFNEWKCALIFGGILTLLYGFIFVLIRLEDTALLVGSIGLFIILAIAMYASRNIDWYGQKKS